MREKEENQGREGEHITKNRKIVQIKFGGERKKKEGKSCLGERSGLGERGRRVMGRPWARTPNARKKGNGSVAPGARKREDPGKRKSNSEPADKPNKTRCPQKNCQALVWSLRCKREVQTVPL